MVGLDQVILLVVDVQTRREFEWLLGLVQSVKEAVRELVIASEEIR